MLIEDVFVAGVGLHLPPVMDAEEAVARGLTDERTVRRTRMRSVCVADESGPEMAAKAARKALAMAGAGPRDIDLVLHAAVYYQGHDLWAPASYVQRESVGNACPAMFLQQLSNGGMAAFELAVSHLLANAARRGALVTTGDRFCLPGFDRWASDPGTVLGDGGTALVLSRSDGFARLRSLVTVSDPGLEAMGRGDDPFGVVPLGAGVPIGIERHRAALVRTLGLSQVAERLHSGQQEALDLALEEADLDAKEITWFVTPNLGHAKMDFQFFTALDLDPGRTTWPWGSTVGHLGGGDQFAGLARLAATGGLAAGQTCALVSAGGSFSWTVAILDVLRAP
ncbi:ketoacyl-ACP synthase III family protein [Actinocorallia aurea]